MTRNPAKDQNDILLIEKTQPPKVPFTRETVGGKAFGLLRMVSAGLPVPPAFVLGTACCRQYFKSKNKLSARLREQLKEHVRALETSAGKTFGSKRKPLLVSVRSGAPVSMPGMMETLLNIGLNDQSVHGMIRATGNPRLAWDCYRRLIQNYAEVVYGIENDAFDQAIKACLKQDGLKSMNELDSVNLRQLCNEFKFVFRDCTGKEFPQDPWKQLNNAVSAVFNSWFSDRAKTYREINHINPDSGTACIVQTMVFGNSSGQSGSGVGFTRNPSNGNNELYVDYLANVQGEDIVSGRHDIQDVETLEKNHPAVFSELQQIKQQLETEFMDMQDFEFTVQAGELFLLQTRHGKRTPMAALKIAIDLVDEKRISPKASLQLLSEIDQEHIYEYRLKKPPKKDPIAIGTTASTGIASGIIALDEDKARKLNKDNKEIVLVRVETSTDDIAAMHLANAVVTVTGGRTSHASVVARQLGIACVVGCREIEVDMKKRCIRIGDHKIVEGDYLTVDADNGLIYEGRLEIEQQQPKELLKRIAEWKQKHSKKEKEVSG